MITFSLARARRILWLTCTLAATRENLLRLDEERAAVLAREGPMDFIVDFTGAPVVAIPSALTHERTAAPVPAPGHHRIYVAPDDHLFGMLRMFAAYQDDPRLQIVRTIDQAFDLLSIEARDFEPLT